MIGNGSEDAPRMLPFCSACSELIGSLEPAMMHWSVDRHASSVGSIEPAMALR
jgi:hypothetical protein